MKNKLMNLNAKASYIDQRHVKIIVAIVSLALFALGAGAPGTSTSF